MRACLIALCALAGCSTPYVVGPLDLARAEQGEIFVEAVSLPNDQFMIRGAVVVDAPPSAVVHLYADVDNYPNWHSTFVHAKVQRRDGNEIDCEITPRAVWGRDFTPMATRIRLDWDAGEISMASFENDWLRAGQTVVKTERLDDGRTLVTGYSLSEVKIAGASFFRGTQEERLAEALVRARSAVKLPRYRAPPPAAANVARTKVVVPGFQAHGVSEDLARTLTRVFAEALMRTSKFSVITNEEALALLHHQQRQEVMGCTGDGCAMEFGRALRAERVITGSVGRVGERFMVNASLLRFPEGTVVQRASADAPGEEALLTRLREAAATLATP